MREHSVPEWYIDSCQKIQYMFPKAHAAAYVIAALRLSWFKIYEKLAYYCAFMTVRGADVDFESLNTGKDAVLRYLNSIEDKRNKNEATAVELKIASTMQIVYEAIVRGVNFLPVDIYKSDAFKYLPEDGAIRIPFSAISGVGTNAAENMKKAREEGGEFSSIEDFQARSGAPLTAIELLKLSGTFGELPESDQISLFDF